MVPATDRLVGSVAESVFSASEWASWVALVAFPEGRSSLSKFTFWSAWFSMAVFKPKRPQKGPLKKKSTKAKRILKCRFCTRDGCPRPVYVDYKDLKTLKVMITRNGHMQARRRTGNCAKFQRAVRDAVLRARFMGLLPFINKEE
jgi:small subunit ribosomal protein S18